MITDPRTVLSPNAISPLHFNQEVVNKYLSNIPSAGRIFYPYILAALESISGKMREKGT